MSEQIKYIQLFQYGGPVVELEIDGEKHLFEPEGVQALLNEQVLENHDMTTLKKVLQDLAAYRFAYYGVPIVNEQKTTLCTFD